MEAEASLVGSDCAVVLDSPSTVDLDLVVVIFPFDSELDDSLRLHDPVEDLVLQIKRVCVDHIDNGCDDLSCCLYELRLCGVLSLKFSHELVKFVHFFLQAVLTVDCRAHRHPVVQHNQYKPVSADVNFQLALIF